MSGAASPAPPSGRGAATRPPALVVALIVLMLWQAYRNLQDVRGMRSAVPGSSLLASLQVMVALLAIVLVSPLWRRDGRAAAGFVVYSALLVAEATVAATIFSAGNARVTAGFSAFGGSLLLMALVTHFTVRWLRRGHGAREAER